VRGSAWIAALSCACGGGDLAPSADAAPHDATAAFCAIPTAMLCDDFEQPLLDRWEHRIHDVTRVDSPTHSGSGAMRASIATAQEASWIGTSPSSLSNATSVSLRFWFYVTAESSVVQTNLGGIQNFVDQEQLTFSGYQDRFGLYRRTSTSASYSSTPIVRERWTCVELDVIVDDAVGSLEMRIDGVTKVMATSIDTRLTNDFRVLVLGLPYAEYPGQGAITVYFDDVYLGRQPHGCGQDL
jgi:hypothetical protein